MALKSIKLENFTVFENIECEFSSGINIFLGENGTGKTHLLKLLYAFAKCKSISNGQSVRLDLGKHPGCFFYELFQCFSVDKYSSLALNKSPEITSLSPETSINFSTSDNKRFNYDMLPDKDVVYSLGKSESFDKNEIPSTYIPAKDILTHSKGLIPMAKKYSDEMPFEKPLLDIIEKANQWKPNKLPKLANITMQSLSIIEKEIGGTVLLENDEFFIKKDNGSKVSFSCEAEGFKKLGLLWHLLMNENIIKRSVLLWDEPEANLNPKLIPVVVDILLELSRNGVQVFLATHEYNLMKYFSVKKKDSDNVAFISLHKTENGVVSEIEDDYNLLEHNSIVEANIKLLEDDIEGVF